MGISIVQPKCKHLKINHVCFADDVILISRNNQISDVMIEFFNRFSNASGPNISVGTLPENKIFWQFVTNIVRFESAQSQEEGELC